jgi:hypothetical protein
MPAFTCHTGATCRSSDDGECGRRLAACDGEEQALGALEDGLRENLDTLPERRA